MTDYPLLDLTGVEEYTDPTRVAMDWYPVNGYFRGVTGDIRIEQGKSNQGKPGNFMFVVPISCTDDDVAGLKGKKTCTWVVFTGVADKGKNKGKPNARLFVPPMMRAAGLSLDEVRARSEKINPEEFAAEFSNHEILYRIYESYDKEAKKWRQRLAFCTPEDLEAAVKSESTREPLGKKLQAQIAGGDETEASTASSGTGKDADVDF